MKTIHSSYLVNVLDRLPFRDTPITSIKVENEYMEIKFLMYDSTVTVNYSFNDEQFSVVEVIKTKWDNKPNIEEEMPF